VNEHEFSEDKNLCDDILKACQNNLDNSEAITPELIQRVVAVIRESSSIDEARENLSLADKSAPVFSLFSIVEKEIRPALFIKNQTYELPSTKLWKEPLSISKALLDKAIPSVGRIQVQSRSTNMKFVGTGWLIGSDIVASAGHVAQHFSEKVSANSFMLKQNVRAQINFAGEHRSNKELLFRIVDILLFKKDPIDLSLLRIEKTGVNNAATRVSLSMPRLALANKVEVDTAERVAVIGYPGENDESTAGVANISRENIRAIFRDDTGKEVYDVKRLMPGMVLREKSKPDTLAHDCSTLSGASGAPVINLKTGNVVGLHWDGEHGKLNKAVPSYELRKFL